MSRRPRHYKKCGRCGKCRYPSQVAAEDMAAYRMHLDPGIIISVYECPVLPGTFHITKTNQYRRMLRQEASRSELFPAPEGPGSPVSR
jgi:hypothetical protein